MNNIKPFDREVMNKVRSLEQDIPPELDQAILENLLEAGSQTNHPDQHPTRQFNMSYAGWTVAAAVILVALLFFFPLFHQQGNGTFTAEAEEVWVQDARVDGQPAETLFINTSAEEDASGMTIVWIEKIATENEDK